MTYLARARGRQNLTIRPDTMVASVECKGRRTAGVRLLDGTLIEAEKVVLAAGAYGSPTILARSGIGPVEEAERLGIQPVLNLPGIGANLSDHALVSIELPTRPSQSPSRFGVHATLHSTIADPNGPPDLMMFTAGPFDVDPEQIPGGAAFGIVVGLMAPRSRGWVRLTSSDPNDPPRIHFGHLTDPEDLDAMLDGITEARRIALSDPVASIVTGAELSPGPGSPPGDRHALVFLGFGERLDVPSSRRHMCHGVGTRVRSGHRCSWVGPRHRGSHRGRRFDHADRPDWNTESSDHHGGRAHCAVAPELTT